MQVRLIKPFIEGIFTSLLIAGSSAAWGAGFISPEAEPSDTITLELQTEYSICFGGTTQITTTISQPKVFFLDEATMPNKGLRVRITNLTSVFSDNKRPYSDREYESEELGSEKIYLAAGDRHRTRTFTVHSDLNEDYVNSFSYRIYEEATDKIIAVGEFESLISQIELPPVTKIGGPGCGINNPPPLPPLPF